jgi:hypothetical protein
MYYIWLIRSAPAFSLRLRATQLSTAALVACSARLPPVAKNRLMQSDLDFGNGFSAPNTVQYDLVLSGRIGIVRRG